MIFSKNLNGVHNINKVFLTFTDGSQLILYRSDNNSSDLLEFAKYATKFDIPQDYKSFIVANLFGQSTRELCGSNFENLNTISDLIFPTVSSETIIPERRYFGSISIGDLTLFLIELPEKVTQARLYTSLEAIEIDDPDVEIKFGVTNENTSSYTSAEKYRLQVVEIQSSKLLIIIISNDGALVNFNLSYESYILSKDPNRNRKYLFLRNDKLKLSVASERTPFIVDTYIQDNLSLTLLGTVKLNSDLTPILLQKQEKFKTSFSYNTEYLEGLIVYYNTCYWISSISGNIGENPETSPWWHLYSSWSNEIEYSKGDIVFHEGVLYRSNSSGNLANNPSEEIWWTIIDVQDNYYNIELETTCLESNIVVLSKATKHTTINIRKNSDLEIYISKLGELTEVYSIIKATFNGKNILSKIESTSEPGIFKIKNISEPGTILFQLRIKNPKLYINYTVDGEEFDLLTSLLKSNLKDYNNSLIIKENYLSLVAGKEYNIILDLHDTAYSFPQGDLKKSIWAGTAVDSIIMSNVELIKKLYDLEVVTRDGLEIDVTKLIATENNECIFKFYPVSDNYIFEKTILTIDKKDIVLLPGENYLNKVFCNVLEDDLYSLVFKNTESDIQIKLITSKK